MNTQFQIGDIVRLNPDAGWTETSLHVLYEVTKVPSGSRQVNYQVTPLGGGRGAKGPANAFLSAGGHIAPSSTYPDYVPAPTMGSVVTTTAHGVKPGNYVVLGEARKPNHVKLVKLGGDNGRYYPAVPTRSCTAVTFQLVAQEVQA